MENLTKSDLKILRSIQLLDLPTRQSISIDVNLSLLKVSKVLKFLEDLGSIRKAGKSFSASGRPSYIYELNPAYLYSLGASISNVGMTIVVINATKKIIRSEKILFTDKALQSDDVNLLINQIIEPLKSIQNDLKDQGKSLSSIGISVPGMIDTAKHIWLSGLQLPGIDHVDINKEICKRREIPVYAEDNSRIISYGEKVLGQGKNIKNFVVLYLGIGVGAGIVINNEIYRGTHGTAGEIGHVISANNNYRCSCGNVGCLETVTSHSGILRIFRDRLSEGVHSPLQIYNQKEGGLTFESILKAADNDDKLARDTLFEIGQFIGDACTILINLFNPEKLIITGSVAIFEKYLSEAIKLSLSRKILPNILEQTVITFTPYSSTNEAHYAALFAISQYWDDLITNNLDFTDLKCK